MPVAQGSRPPARQALMIGLGALCGVLAVVFLVTRLDQLGGGGTTEVPVGNPVFTIGQASDFASLIAQEGPLFLPDAAGGDRGVYLQHTGPDETSGWSAFGVRPPDAPDGCLVEWDGVSRTFRDGCDGTEYPEDGAGLVQYAVSVDPDGDLIIRL